MVKSQNNLESFFLFQFSLTLLAGILSKISRALQITIF